MILTASIKAEDGQTVGMIVLDPKTFRTGSTGYFGMGKLTLDGKRYQAQVQLVAIGSKKADSELGK